MGVGGRGRGGRGQAKSERVASEMLHIYKPTHQVSFTIGEGEEALACIRNNTHLVAIGANETALKLVRQHVRCTMLEEHLQNIPGGFLFRRQLRTQRSVTGEPGSSEDAGQTGSKRPRDDDGKSDGKHSSSKASKVR